MQPLAKLGYSPFVWLLVWLEIAPAKNMRLRMKGTFRERVKNDDE